MSGGVDSSLAAKLMKDKGFDFIGYTMKLFHNEDVGMTITVPATEETIKLLREKAPWCKLVVGGAVLIKEYAPKSKFLRPNVLKSRGTRQRYHGFLHLFR